MPYRFLPLLLAAILSVLAGVHSPLHAQETVVMFNEIMYHPADTNPDVDPPIANGSSTTEWVELHNTLALDVDLSGWRLSGGIDFNFPSGTVVPTGGFLLIAEDPSAFPDLSEGVTVLGPYEGSLANEGEELLLRDNSDRLMDRLDYRDNDPWPLGPDGSGHSLTKRIEAFGSEEVENWVHSSASGGTPGRTNYSFPFAPPPVRLNSLAFNEFEGVGDDTVPFWLELKNHSSANFNLANVQITTRTPGGNYTFTEGSLAPGEHLVVNAETLGFTPLASERLFLFHGNGSLLDAAAPRDLPNARRENGERQWFNLLGTTPGEPNVVQLNHDVVVNEIMYHHQPLRIASEAGDAQTLLAWDAPWRYFNGEEPLPENWQQSTHAADGVAWIEGPGIFGFAAANAILPQPIGTDLPRTLSHQLETEFELPAEFENSYVSLRHLVDDGAVFYLNGTEILRYNLPEGAISANTRALTDIPNASTSTAFELPLDLLQEGTNRLSIQVQQVSLFSNDLIIGAEITLDDEPPGDASGQRYEEDDEEWIELYNRGEEGIDLTGWRLDGGITFDFPQGTEIQPGEFLVVARDQATLAERYPEIPLIGNFDGQLANSGETLLLIDSLGNAVEEIPYEDGGHWPANADGGGSSLERIHPNFKSSHPSAWSDSEEASKARWHTFSYRGVASPPPNSNDPTQWQEFVFGLLDSGEVLIDDLQVIENPGGTSRDLIRNGDFQNGTSPFRILGNHRHSQIVPDPDNPENQVLQLVAVGPTEHMHNHVEITLADGARIQNGTEYEIAFRARWVGGSNQLNTRLYFNRLTQTTLVPTPMENGTPGEINSKGNDAAPPLVDYLTHSPAVPRDTQTTRVTARTRGGEGTPSATLHYRAGSTAWQSLEMEGSLTDPGSQEYEWTASIPSQSARSVIQYYVEAKDETESTSVYPPGGESSRALIQVLDSRSNQGVGETFRVVLTEADATFLHRDVNVMSNERLLGTVIHRERDIYHDVRIRLKGSGYGRNSTRGGFNIRFRPEAPLLGVHEAISIDRNGGPHGEGVTHQELLAKHIALRAGDIPTMHDDVVYLISPRGDRDGPAQILLAPFDNPHLEARFEDEGDGTLYEFELIYWPSTSTGGVEGVKLPPNNVLGVDFVDMGPSKEAYRWHYQIKNRRNRDDFSHVIDMAQTFSLTGAAFESQIDDVIDVDQWMRAFAYESLAGINDTYNQGLPHNLMLYARETDGRVLALPWDQDFAFSHPVGYSIYGQDSQLQKVIALPQYRRLFQGHLLDIINTTFNNEYLDPWIEHIGARSTTTATATLKQRVQGRREFVLNALPDEIPFSIESPADGSTVDTPTATLRGRGWIDVRAIRLAGSPSPLPLHWLDAEQWEVEVPLQPGSQTITLEALNHQESVIGDDAITLNSTYEGADALLHLRITELHYHPAPPSTEEGPISADDNDFEFLELHNLSDSPLELEGITFTQGITFTFPTGTSLGGNQTAVIVAHREAFEARYGTQITILGDYQGTSLSNSGETLALVNSEGLLIQEFSYADDWYPETDGEGYSLTAITPLDPQVDRSQSTAWALSGVIGGTPGTLGDSQPTEASYADWADAVFTPAELADPAISGPLADPDGDGTPNFVAAFFNRTPSGASLSGELIGGITHNGETEDGSPIWTLRFTPRHDINFRFQQSTDLAQWIGVGLDILDTRSPSEGWIETDLIIPAPAPTDTGPNFWRLKLELQELPE